ncbi:MAG: response regulator [Ignavibacteriaceae bacterium]|nr:response regulator [Ignavibacteriaceae bacterium]
MEVPKKVLVVDDDQLSRRVISFNLSKRGLNPLEAENGNDAYQILTENEVDLILCDIEMTGLNGYEFFNMVRSKSRFNSIPFIFITSHTSTEEKAKAYSLGADNFISKPFNMTEFVAKVESSLKRIEINKSYGRRRLPQIIDTEKSNRVLIVDDQPDSAEVLRLYLEKDHLICKIIENPFMAIQAIYEFQPDLIMCDYSMPGINGFELRKKILADNKIKDIPFVFLTSIEDESVVLDGYNLNIKDYIIKNTPVKIVAVKVKNMIKSIQQDRLAALSELKDAASEMHLDLTPDIPDEKGDFKISHWYQPFKDIPGGDFMDFIEMPDEKYILVVGDIMGKKWGAWFYAFSFISYIRSSIRVVCGETTEYSAALLLRKVNSAIYNDAKISEIFSAVSILIFSPDQGEIDYSGAGDLPMLHYLRETGEVKEYGTGGILLGARADGKYDDIRISFNRGDRIVLFTDGIIDSSNIHNETFGMERLKQVFLKYAANEDFLLKFKEEFSGFTAGNFSDDISLLTIARRM